MDGTATKGSALVRIESVMSQFTTCHPANGVNEVLTIKVFETILIRIVGIRTTIKLVGQGIFDPILITSILGKC